LSAWRLSAAYKTVRCPGARVTGVGEEEAAMSVDASTYKRTACKVVVPVLATRR